MNKLSNYIGLFKKININIRHPHAVCGHLDLTAKKEYIEYLRHSRIAFDEVNIKIIKAYKKEHDLEQLQEKITNVRSVNELSEILNRLDKDENH